MTIFLKHQSRYKNGRTYLQICRSTYSRSKGYAVITVLRKLGYLDELEKIYVDPVTYFKQEAKKIVEEEEANKAIPMAPRRKHLGSFLPINILKETQNGQPDEGCLQYPKEQVCL